ncbi:MAG: glycosyltransferase family 4 protein [Nocardioidaceae bacterium]
MNIRSRGSRPAAPRRPHVAVVVENLPAYEDTRLRKQLRDLLGAGYRISVITQAGPENQPYRELDNLALLEYRPPPEPRGPIGHAREYLTSFAWAALRLGRLRRRGPIDVLQVCQPPDVYFPLGWVVRRLGARVLVDQRDLMPELFAARYPNAPHGLTFVLHWLERRTQRSADHSIGVNDYLRERMIAAGGAPDRVSIVRNGPVLSRVDRARPDQSWRRHAHQVCWIGKMGRQDRVDLVLKVAEHVIRDLGRDDIGFVLLGDGECLKELRELVRERDLGPWIALPGWLSEAEVFGCLAAADVGIDTSLQSEVSPVKAMEYMAFGLPVVAFDLLETRRTVESAGVYVSPGDVTGFGDELTKLVDDAEGLEKLGRTGRERVETELAWERQVETYLDVVERLTTDP